MKYYYAKVKNENGDVIWSSTEIAAYSKSQAEQVALAEYALKVINLSVEVEAIP